MRWKIETFYKILKSGCKAEDSKLRTADRLANLISAFCILSWRVFWLTLISRCAPEAPGTSRRGIHTRRKPFAGACGFRLAAYPAGTAALAKPDQGRATRCYLVRAGEPLPGNTVMWRGMQRLTDIQLGYELALNRTG